MAEVWEDEEALARPYAAAGWILPKSGSAIPAER
jgi:hypothetical protein